MKTISLIAVSTLLGSAVSGQMIAPQKADQGSDFQEVAPPRVQEFPVPKAHVPAPKALKAPAAPANAHPVPAKPHAVPNRVQGAIPNRAEGIIIVTKTKTQIVYPTPNEMLWKNLPTLPADKHRGKIVAEFYVDDKGHYQEIKKHGHHHGLKYSNSGNQDEYHKFAIDGAHPHGNVIYGGPWGGSGMSSHKGGYKHKESLHEGKEDNHYYQHGKKPHEEHKKGGSYHDSKSHEEHKKGDSYHESKHESHHESGHGNKDKSNKKHEKDSQTSKNKNDWKKKTAEGYQAKGIDDIIAQNNVSTPIDMGASGSAVEGALSASISGPASAAQKTPAAGSASAMAGASAKNAAASSTAASHASSASAKPSTSTSSGSTSAASNTRQVALSFVAVVAATAVWCLA